MTETSADTNLIREQVVELLTARWSNQCEHSPEHAQRDSVRTLLAPQRAGHGSLSQSGGGTCLIDVLSRRSPNLFSNATS